jgi:hypothetical protein
VSTRLRAPERPALPKTPSLYYPEAEPKAKDGPYESGRHAQDPAQIAVWPKPGAGRVCDHVVSRNQAYDRSNNSRNPFHYRHYTHLSERCPFTPLDQSEHLKVDLNGHGDWNGFVMKRTWNKAVLAHCFNRFLIERMSSLAIFGIGVAICCRLEDVGCT